MFQKNVAAGCGMQGIGQRWGASRCSEVVGRRRIVRKHDCDLSKLYHKHSNAQGFQLALALSGPPTITPRPIPPHREHYS